MDPSSPVGGSAKLLEPHMSLSGDGWWVEIVVESTGAEAFPGLTFEDLKSENDELVVSGGFGMVVNDYSKLQHSIPSGDLT